MLFTKVYACLGYGKSVKSITKLTRYMNACIRQIIHQIFLTRMQSKQDVPIPVEEDNASDNFGTYENEQFTL